VDNNIHVAYAAECKVLCPVGGAKIDNAIFYAIILLSGKENKNEQC